MRVAAALLSTYRTTRAMAELPSSKRHCSVGGAGSSSVPEGPPRVLVLAGPTGVGKSALAERLCAALPGGGEIISADSVQVYRHLNIGSAKPTQAEQAALAHHLIDIADPAAVEGYTAGQFCRDATRAIADIWARGKTPVVVGGTMLYHQWLVHGVPDAPPSNPAVAAQVEAELAPYRAAADWDGGLARLSVEHPARAHALTKNDWYRLARAIEVVRTVATRDADVGHLVQLGIAVDIISKNRLF